jgi:hypothetical protein
MCGPVEQNRGLDSNPHSCAHLIFDKGAKSIRFALQQISTGKSRVYTGTINIGKDFLSRTQAAQQLRERIDKWDYMKLKSFCTRKGMALNSRDHPQNGRISLTAIHQTNN